MGIQRLILIVFAIVLFALLPEKWKVPALVIVVLGGLIYTNAHGAGTENIVSFFTDWSKVK